MASMATAQERESKRISTTCTKSRAAGPANRATDAAIRLHNITDAQIAAFLNGGNEAEVNVAKLAEKQAKHDDVKKIAREMAEAHTKLWARLNKVALQGGLGETTRGRRNSLLRCKGNVRRIEFPGHPAADQPAMPGVDLA